MIVSFLVFVFALFLVLGSYLLATHGTDQKRARLQKRLSEALLHSANTEDVDVVLARNEMMSEIPWVNRTLINVQAALQLKRMLDQADLHITPSRLLMFSFMSGMLGALAASVLTVFIPIMILAGLICAAIPLVHVWWKRKNFAVLLTIIAYSLLQYGIFWGFSLIDVIFISMLIAPLNFSDIGYQKQNSGS